MTISPDVKALIFDCDGTLADSMPLHFEAWQETMEDLGGHITEKIFYDTAGMRSDQITTVLNETFGYNFDPQKTAEAKEARFFKKLSQIQPIESVVAIAKEYKDKMPIAVGSGGEMYMVSKILKAVDLEDFFDTVVTSEQVAHGKPAPDIFLEAARRMDVEPQYCQVFEDGDAGIEAAEKAGMIVTDIRTWTK